MLGPCPKCSRHVRRGSACCPFCGAATPGLLPASAIQSASSQGDDRPTRAAMVGGQVLGAAALAAAALLGSTCAEYGAPPYDGGPGPDTGRDAARPVDSGEPDGDR